MQKMYYIRIHLITDSITLVFILFINRRFFCCCAFNPMNRLTIELNEIRERGNSMARLNAYKREPL